VTNERKSWEQSEDELFEGIPVQDGAEAVQVAHARGDSSAPPPQSSQATDGVPTLSKRLGPCVQRKRKGTSKTAAATGTAIVPASHLLAKKPQPSTAVSREVSRFFPGLPEAVVVRETRISAEYRDEKIETSLPPDVAKFLDTWLRRNHLMFCAVDQQFWSAFEQVLTSIEGFSVEAVEESLKICLVGARAAARRTAIYSELRAIRELRKIRNFSMKLQTSKLLVDRYLATDADMMKGDYESRHPGSFTSPFKVGDQVVHESRWDRDLNPDDIGTVDEIFKNGKIGVQFPPDYYLRAHVSEWRLASAEELAMRVQEEAEAEANTKYLVSFESQEEEYMPDEKVFATLVEAKEFLKTLPEKAQGDIMAFSDADGHRTYYGQHLDE